MTQPDFACVQGIPVKDRPWAWPALSGADARKRKQMAGYFDAMVHRGEVDSEVAHQIELVSLEICNPWRFIGLQAHAKASRSPSGRLAGVRGLCTCELTHSFDD